MMILGAERVALAYASYIYFIALSLDAPPLAFQTKNYNNNMMLPLLLPTISIVRFN